MVTDDTLMVAPDPSTEIAGDAEPTNEIAIETPHDAVDPKALAELMPAFERLIRIGVYYPTGHPCCDLTAESARSAIHRVVGKAPNLQIEIRGNDLFVQGVDLDPESRGVANFRQLLEEVGAVDLAIDPEISAEDLHKFVTRLLELRQEVRSARSFTQLEIDGLPTSVQVRDREFLARRKELEVEDGDANDTGVEGPGLETLLSAAEQVEVDLGDGGLTIHSTVAEAETILA